MDRERDHGKAKKIKKGDGKIVKWREGSQKGKKIRKRDHQKEKKLRKMMAKRHKVRKFQKNI